MKDGKDATLDDLNEGDKRPFRWRKETVGCPLSFATSSRAGRFAPAPGNRRGQGDSERSAKRSYSRSATPGNRGPESRTLTPRSSSPLPCR